MVEDLGLLKGTEWWEANDGRGSYACIEVGVVPTKLSAGSLPF